MKCFFPVFSFLCLASSALAQRRTPSSVDSATNAAGAFSCCGGGIFFILMVVLFFVGLFALNIAMLVWVARDAKSRGMDNSVMWMILVFFTSVLGLVIYIFSRPQGNLIACPTCNNKRLEVSAKCPHCGNP